MAGVISFVLTGHEPADASADFERELVAAGVGVDATALLVDARRSQGGNVASASAWLASVIAELNVPEFGTSCGLDPNGSNGAFGPVPLQPEGDGTGGAAHRSGRGRRRVWPALVVGALGLLGIGAGLLASQTASDGAATGRECPSSMASDWSALALPASTAPRVSWVDVDGDCTHDFYAHAPEGDGSTGPVDIGTQHTAVLAVVLAATSVVGPDYGACSASDWELAADEYVAETGLTVSWTDRDSDCLHDAYELNAVGLNPDAWDTDQDGVGDALDVGGAAGPIAHAPDRQLVYLQDLYALDSAFPVPDSTVCRPGAWEVAADQWIREQDLDDAWMDPDGDCLDSDYERGVVDTSPTDADTDGDGVGDGTDPDSSNGTIEAIDVQLHRLGVSRPGRPGPRDGETFEQPRADGPD